MNKDTNAKCGIVRRYSSKGNSLSELVMFGQKTIGLSRHFNSEGFVAYLISDKNGVLMESKYFD